MSIFARSNLDPYIKDNSKPILLLHGLGYNQAGFLFLRLYLHWNRFSNIYSLNMDEHIFGSKSNLKEYKLKVKNKIDTIYKNHNSNIVIIGHSFGGIIGGLICLETNKIDSLITLGTPWYGTDMVDWYNTYILPFKKMFGIVILNKLRLLLKSESMLLKNLREDLSKKNIKIFNIGSISDWIVNNKSNKTPFKLDYCEHYNYHIHGHNSMLFCPLTFNKIKNWLINKNK
uniref:GPI inositol-deacylase PGAP1-like alpha/beta domain-containing protein n=1 Tax=viral metagenome TaxID=1070528 RepID=A0A6C0ACA7_9ZZZZ